jgi:hypothetical protein
MAKGKSSREIVTHDELIQLFRECKRMKRDASKAMCVHIVLKHPKGLLFGSWWLYSYFEQMQLPYLR